MNRAPAIKKTITALLVLCGGVLAGFQVRSGYRAALTIEAVICASAIGGRRYQERRQRQRRDAALVRALKRAVV